MYPQIKYKKSIKKAKKVKKTAQGKNKKIKVGETNQIISSKPENLSLVRKTLN